MLHKNLLELAFRRVWAEHSDRPMYFVLPALRSESSAGMDSSRVVSTIVSRLYQEKEESTDEILTRINPVEVVEIRREAQSLDGAVNVAQDMGSFVCD